MKKSYLQLLAAAGLILLTTAALSQNVKPSF
jgi:hypothetical protein